MGARKPSDYGLYFAWGDTQGYTKDQIGTGSWQHEFASDWSDYKWRLSGDSWNNIAFTKYTTEGAKLELEDDAAHVNMSGDWHMPTDEQIQDLLNNTTSKSTTLDDVKGELFTSKNDTSKSKSIFIPAAGYALDGSVRDGVSNGRIWSSTLTDLDSAWYLDVLPPHVWLINPNHNWRNFGNSVRGVIDG